MVSAGRPAAVECSLPQPWGLSLRDFRKTRPGLFDGKPKGSNTEVSYASVAKTTVYSFTLFGELLFGRDSNPLDHVAECSGLTIGEPVVATVAEWCPAAARQEKGSCKPLRTAPAL